MSEFIITFYERDQKGHRRKKFPEEFYYTFDEDGNVIGWHNGMKPTTIYTMMTWLEEQPLMKMLKSYGISYAFTNATDSSISINIADDDPEMVDEIVVSLKMFAGKDCVFRKPDELPPRRSARELLVREPDRYAR